MFSLFFIYLSIHVFIYFSEEETSQKIWNILKEEKMLDRRCSEKQEIVVKKRKGKKEREKRI